MPPRIHAFAGASAEPMTQAPGMDDDEGAPPELPGTNVTILNADGEILSSTSPDSPEELERRRAAGAAKLASRPKPAAQASPAGMTAPVAAQPPLSATLAAAGNPERALRLRCLELAARSGETDPDKLMERAKAFLSFVDG